MIPNPDGRDIRQGSGADLWVALVLMGSVLVAYANAFHAGLIFDSAAIVLDDPRLRALSWENLARIWQHTYWWPTTASNLFRPFTTLSYLVNYAVLGNGGMPFGYHAVNLALQGLNVLLAWDVMWRLSHRRELAALVALLWGVHPVATEAVTNVVGRADLLAACGVLSTVDCLLRSGRRWVGGGVIATTVAVFSKESGVAVFGVLALMSLLFDVPSRRWHRLRTWAPLAVPLVLFAFQRAQVIPSTPLQTPLTDNPLGGADFWTGRLTALAVLGRYLGLAVWPWTLSNDYSFAQIPLASGTPAEWLLWGTLLAILVLTTGIIWRLWQRPSILATAGSREVARRASGKTLTTPGEVPWERLFLMAVGFAAVTMLPAANLLFPIGTIMAERLLYLPLLGILAAIVIGLAGLAVRLRAPAVLPTLVCVLALGAMVRTWMRNEDWGTEVTLWTSAAVAVPESFKAHQGLAEALYEAAPTAPDWDRVIAESEHSVAILDRLPISLPASSWGTTFIIYRRAAAYHLERGNHHRNQGQAEASREDYERALVLAERYRALVVANASSADMARELGEVDVLTATLHAKLGRPDDAVAAATRAHANQPLSPESYRALASSLVQAERFDEAMEWLFAGFTVTGDQTLRAASIDYYRLSEERARCALRNAPTGLVLNPECELVRGPLCRGTRRAIAILTQAQKLAEAEQVRAIILSRLPCEPG